MVSFVYCSIQDKLIPKEERLYEEYLKKDHLHMTKPNSNEKVTLHYIGDEIEPTRHMCSGKYFTSKKKYRNETKAYNCIEVGTETKTMLTPRKPIKLSRRQRRNHIRKAIYDLRNGNVPKQV